MSKNQPRDRRRAAARALVQMLRPRCMICDKPIDYAKLGVRRRTFTCGMRCARRRWTWFVRDRSNAPR